MPLIQGRKNLDLFIITDMKITNLETLIGFFGKIQNRITAVHIGETLMRQGLKRRWKEKNISIFTVKRKEDIPHIVLGRIREYFNTTAEIRNSLKGLYDSSAVRILLVRMYSPDYFEYGEKMERSESLADHEGY